MQFSPVYIDKKILKIVPSGVIRNIRRFNPDVVLVPECGLISLLVLIYRWITRGKYKVVSMIDDSYDMICGNQFTRLHAYAEKLMIPHFDNVINVDSRVAAHFHKKYSKGIFFPIISDEEKMSARYRNILPVSERFVKQFDLERKKIALFVGRMVGLKNVDGLIRAFRKIENKDYRLILVGSGEDHDRLMRMSEGDDRIMHVGRYEGDELYAWYNIAHVFCLPSFTEPFGAVTSEALTGGCQCLISNRAGSRCLIQRGINGEVFDPCNENQLRSLLAGMLEKQSPLSLPLRHRENLTGLHFKSELRRVTDSLNQELLT